MCGGDRAHHAHVPPRRVEAKDVPSPESPWKTRLHHAVRLFNLGADSDQAKLVDDFKSTCRKRDIRLSQEGYSPSSFTYAIVCRNVDDVEALSRVIGVRSIVHMPFIRTIGPRILNPRPLPDLPSRDDVTGDFPVVVVVDSGISDSIPGWRAGYRA